VDARFRGHDEIETDTLPIVSKQSPAWLGCARPAGAGSGGGIEQSGHHGRQYLPTSLLYGLTVLIWGSSWYAIRLQTGVVSVDLAIGYRFVLAAVILAGYCLLTGRRLRYGLRDHLFMAAQGFTLFSLNYMLFYRASFDMPSGLMSVCFSTILLMNIANGHLFFKTKVEPRVFLGALLGLAGLTLVFWPEVAGFGANAVTGLLLSLVATYSASLGNMISVRHKQREIPVIESNAIGMAYGAISSLAVAALLGRPLVYDFRPQFTLALLFLSIFASIIGFGSFLTLIQRIGADRAAYATVLFPIVALAISTWLESYAWTPLAAAGVALVLLGNILVLMRRRPALKESRPA
jgi:drug/metabolite transporter (DMT)-like permease